MLALVVVVALAAAPDAAAERGRAAIARFECARCHALPKEAKAPKLAPAKQCASCHVRSARGEGAPSTWLAQRWASSVQHWLDVPPLDGVTRHLRRDWVKGYLLRPHDLRPGLEESMPRLPLTDADAGDIAAFLVKVDDGKDVVWSDGASVDAGRVLFGERGCVACHAFSGATHAENGVGRAPDLRHVRARMAPSTLLAWLTDPQKLAPKTPMPTPNLTSTERESVARFLLEAPLSVPTTTTPTTNLPLLTRRVGWIDVERIFASCVHCHDDAVVGKGEGGPGHTGGMGFTGAGVDLSSYAAVLRTRSKGRLITAGDSPLLVSALLLRQREVEQGVVDEGGAHGMPLGLPPLSAEDIQLVASWVSQGMPR